MHPDTQDKFYMQAVKIVVDSQRASISRVQRELRIGYNHAARLLEAMESEGVISPADKNGNRNVLTPNAQAHPMRNSVAVERSAGASCWAALSLACSACHSRR